jgi:putative hemolysin
MNARMRPTGCEPGKTDFWRPSDESKAVDSLAGGRPMRVDLVIPSLIFLFLITLSAFLSRCEAALVVISRKWFEEGLERRKRDGLAQVLERRGKYSLAILSARMFVNIGAISLAAVIVSEFFAPNRLYLWLVAEMVVLGVVYLVLVETLPKLLVLRQGAEVSARMNRFIEILGRIFSPLVKLLQRITGSRAAELSADSALAFATDRDEDLTVAMEAEDEQGLLEEEEREMIHSIFELGETQVKEVMIPRIDMTCVDSKHSPQQALDVIVKSGHSRIPVFKEKIDHIVGLLYAKDLLKPLKDGQSDFRILDLVREVFFIPETKLVSELLKEFQARRMHMAVVVDEYGGTAGLVTLEDILEEIVGEIRDEYDIEEDLIKVQDERTAEVLAKINLHDLNEELGLELPDEEFDTLGGFVYHLAGRVPEKGTKLSHGNVEFTVLDVRGQRISKVKIAKLATSEAEQPPEGKKT